MLKKQTKSSNIKQLLIITILSFLFTKSYEKESYYYPVSFNSYRLQQLILVQNETLTVDMQFSENFTTTRLRFTQRDDNDLLINTWIDNVFTLPYRFTKFYSDLTKVIINCLPTQKNPKILITFNYYLQANTMHDYFNFIDDSSPQTLAAFQVQHRNQRITIFPELCISSWSGWSVGLKYENGTQVTALYNHSDTFCTTGNVYSNLFLKSYFVEQSVTIYPYLYRYNSSQARPASHSFYFSFFLHSRKYCRDFHASNNPINQTHCQCYTGFVWVIQNDRCERDCLFYNYTLGLKQGSVTQCICPYGKKWNQNQLKCVCQQPQFFIEGDYCKRNCKWVQSSTGNLIESSLFQCQCQYQHIWNDSLKQCQYLYPLNPYYGLQWWKITISTLSVMGLVTLIVVSVILIKKKLLKKNRTSPKQLQQNSEQKINIQSMKIVDFYQ